MFSDLINGISDTFNNVKEMFNPSNNETPDVSSDDKVEETPSQEENGADIDNPAVQEKELPAIAPAPGMELSLEAHLAHLGGYAVAYATDKAKQSHSDILTHNKHLEDHNLFLSKIRERDPDEGYDYSNDEQVKSLVAKLRKLGLDIPKETKLNKNQCLALLHRIEGSSRSIDVKLKMKMNEFNEHSRLRDTIFELLKSCHDKLHKAKLKASSKISH